MHTRVSLDGEARIEQSTTDEADMSARSSVNRQHVFALYSFSLERRATHVTYERTTAAVN